LTVLGHGGLWGAVAEVGGVFLFLVIVGFFLWRSSRKERSNRSGDLRE
jgi:peptidoglycan/LPS O-acetylase OafA/YrhL